MELYQLVLGFGALSVGALIFYGVIMLAMLGAVSADRHMETQSLKWWIFTFVVTSATAHVFFADYSHAVLSTLVLLALGQYLLIGIAYSVLAFVLEVRKSAALHKRDWAECLHSKNFYNQPSRFEMMKAVHEKGAVSGYWNDVHSFADWFCTTYARSDNLIRLKLDVDGVTPTPYVNKPVLVRHAGAWILFWPFYLITLIIGDVLVKGVKYFVDLIVTLSGGFVRAVFSDSFKL